MYFKNAKFYLLTQNVDFSGLTQALENIPFHPCGDHTMATLGFSPVIGSLLVHEVNGFYTVKLLKESKIIPARVVAREVEVRAKILEAETGAPLGKKARADLKEQVVARLLPRAFTDQTATMATIIPSHKLIIVNASGDGEAEIFLAVLRKALGSLPVVPLAHNSLAVKLTEWVKTKPHPKFELLEEVELNAMDGTKATIRAKNLELDSEEIIASLDSGKLIQKLAVEFDDQLTAVITEDGSAKRIKYSNRIMEEAEDIPKSEVELRVDTEIFIGASALLDLVIVMKEAFNLGVENVEFVSGGEHPTTEATALIVDPTEPEDPFYFEARDFVIETRNASVSTLQRKFRIGYNRAARLIETMVERGVVSEPGHNGLREVLM